MRLGAIAETSAHVAYLETQGLLTQADDSVPTTVAAVPQRSGCRRPPR
jgi:hypothetical protein